MNNSEIFCNDYQVFRKDRVGSKSGGGVLVAVHCSLLAEEVPLRSEHDSEFICIRLRINEKSKSNFVACSYIPPSSSLDTYMEHLRLIGSVSSLLEPTSEIIYVGDFNLPLTSWVSTDDSNSLLPLSSSAIMCEFWDGVFELGLKQVNFVKNVNNRVLDLVFTTSQFISLSRTTPLVLPEDKHHPTLELVLDLPSEFALLTCRNKPLVLNFNFSRTNFMLLKSFLLNAIWNQYDGLEMQIEHFYEMLNTGFSLSVPTQVNSAQTGPLWFTKELKAQRNLRNRLKRKLDSTGSLAYLAQYIVARNKFNVLNRKCYSSYVSRMRSVLFKNPKHFFSFVNSKRKVNGFPSSMNLKGVESSDDATICEMFASFFRNIYSSSTGRVSYPYKIYSSNSILDIILSEEEVFNGLVALKHSNSPGPDGVPTSVLIACARELSGPLTKLFNDSLASGIFPSYWKSSYIIPIFKSGNRSNVENYRGIAKLSAIPKLFEKLVTHRLSHMVGSLLSPFQHGFIKGRSSTTNLMEFTSHVFAAFRNKCQVDAIYTDFSKAFDTVLHNLLVYKLDALGFTPKLVHWITSYLTNRTQKVRFNNFDSSDILVSSGVPQGSHLGPLLFVLYLNDLPSVVKFSNMLMFADDVKLFMPIRSVVDYNFLQEDLNALTNWCILNGMSLNKGKCKKLSFCRSTALNFTYSVDSHILENVFTFVDLGIILDSKLRFDLHINSCINKARSTLAFIKRWSKEFDDPYLTKRLFETLVRPGLEYASVVWWPYNNCYIDRIESIQKQFLLFALRSLGWNYNDLPPYESRLMLIHLPSLDKRRYMLSAMFIVKLIKGHIDSSFLVSQIKFNVPGRTTRNFLPISLPIARSNYDYYNPFRRVCLIYNEIYQTLPHTESLNVIKQYLIRN